MHFLVCPKGCVRHVTRYTNGVAAFAMPGAFGVAQQKTARKVATPAAMRADFDQMVGRTQLRDGPPTLEFYDDLHGVGGMFIPSQWVIIVGMQDQRDIATRVVSSWPGRVEQIYRNTYGKRPTAVELREFTLAAAIRRCMAHELGHAMLSIGYVNPYAPDEEAGADYYAGKFDAAQGRRRDLGEMFFYSIGCVGPSCQHPDPPSRASAYAHGYNEQAAA